MCSTEALEAIRANADSRLSAGPVPLAIVVLPGSLNPVHSEHVSSLEIARTHLEQQGLAVIAGFLQPSSEGYVGSKVGQEWAMTFAHRAACCDLAGEANAASHPQGERWIHTWRSGTTNGFAVPRQVQDYLHDVLQRRFQVHMVCGGDLAIRCDWTQPAPVPIVVVPRPNVSLSESERGPGWQLACGDTKAVSSTLVREAMAGRDWARMVEEGCDAAVVAYMQAEHDKGQLFMKHAARGA